MSPASIPRPQSQRVALYEQRFGKFDSGKNAYWSLRKERPVTLAEGARFDVDMRAGRLAPARTATVVRGVGTVPSRTGATSYKRHLFKAAPVVSRAPQGAPPMRDVLGYPKMSDRFTLYQGPVAPQERTSVMPTEARRIDALPASPPPGPARPPSEPLFDAIMRQLQEKKAGPATAVVAVRPAFAAPARPFASASPAPIAAGFDMKQLALPLALVAGAFVVSKLL